MAAGDMVSYDIISSADLPYGGVEAKLAHIEFVFSQKGQHSGICWSLPINHMADSIIITEYLDHHA